MTNLRHSVSATKKPRLAAKRRHDVAMGASPWTRRAPQEQSSEGTAWGGCGITHATPAGLDEVVGIGVHGLTPVATTFRPSGTGERSASVFGLAVKKLHLAAKRRHDVAMGVSPWTRRAAQEQSPEGTACARRGITHVTPAGLSVFVVTGIHGLVPVATAFRPSGTGERLVGAFGSAARKPRLAAKRRHDVAMGVSPWTHRAAQEQSPEGTACARRGITHVTPAGLSVFVVTGIHGLVPVATAFRPFGTGERLTGAFASAARKPRLAAKRRHIVAMGASPWTCRAAQEQSPEGTACARRGITHVTPAGLSVFVVTGIHGLVPVATAFRPSGTGERLVGAFVGQFEESLRLEEAIKSNLEARGYGA